MLLVTRVVEAAEIAGTAEEMQAAVAVQWELVGPVAEKASWGQKNMLTRRGKTSKDSSSR